MLHLFFIYSVYITNLGSKGLNPVLKTPTYINIILVYIIVTDRNLECGFGNLAGKFLRNFGVRTEHLECITYKHLECDHAKTYQNAGFHAYMHEFFTLTGLINRILSACPQF